MATHSPAEQALVQQLFNQADPQKLGIITGDAALQVFSKTNLPSTTLGEIWAIADKDNNGFLTKKDTATALRLIGHAQKGVPVTEELANKPGPLAYLEGVSPAIPSAPRSPAPTANMTGSLPPFTPDDKNKFLRIFVGAGPVNGLLSGDKARDIFLKSKLPFEKLSQIWQLADTQNRGSLDSIDFAIAMYFVRSAMSNASLSLPASLPVGLYEQAGGKSPSVVSHGTGGSTGLPSSPLGSTFLPGQTSIKPQYTGGALNAVRPQYMGQSLQPQTTAAPSAASPFPNAIKLQATSNQFWDVSPSEKNTFDEFFKTLDAQNRGYIEGDVAVPFLLQSGLGEDVLAQVWDLADMRNDGKLTRDTFAVAMHLINGKLAGKPLPDRLPDALIPPSQRTQLPTAIARPQSAPVSQIQRDLFELENSSPGLPTTPEQPTDGSFGPQRGVSAQNTGTSSSAFPLLSAALPGSAVVSPPRSQPQSPFAPPAPTAPSVAIRDLLGDDDDGANENAQIHANSAEIGNIQNKLNSTQRSLKSTQEERKTLEETIAAQASQLSSLQSQLSTATAAYDTEKKLLENLQERMTTQNIDIQKTREELIHRESELSALKLEKGEVEGTLLRDKEEVRQLQSQMKEVNDNAELIKGEIDRVKKEARQQKGRLAIAKKQLASSQSEKEKVVQELEVAKSELEQINKEVEETETQITFYNTEIEKAKADHTAIRTASPPPAEVAAEVHIPDTPDILSTSTASVKSTNPFEKLAMVNSGSKPSSPFQIFTPNLPASQPTAADKNASLDDPFGLDREAPLEVSHEASQAQATAEPEVIENKAIAEPTTQTESSREESSPVLASPGSPLAAENFPPLEEVAPQTSVKHKEGNGGNDAGKEIEPADESDSSDDEDDIPLGAVKATQTGEGKPKTPPGLRNGTPVGTSSVSAFDDIFAPALTNSVEAELPETPTPVLAVKSLDAFDSAFVNDLTPVAPNQVEVKEPTKLEVSGVDAFDEALGKLAPSPGSATRPTQFSFESNFGDTFDFGKSSELPDMEPAVNKAPETPVPIAGQPAQASATSSAYPSLPPIATDSQPLSFDDAFGETTAKPAAHTNGIETKAPNGGTSFDDVFETSGAPLSSSPNTSRQDQEPQIGTPRNTTSMDRGSSPAPRLPERPTPPTSPNRTMSSHRSTSPTPRRPLSPPIRKSSGGSKLGAPEDKRSHKLSIRFPFGRKGKDKDKAKKGIQLPDHDLTPVGEQTPANDDDTEPLKALVQMGFSRGQALTALEDHNFDVSRALNSLLGSQ